MDNLVFVNVRYSESSGTRWSDNEVDLKVPSASLAVLQSLYALSLLSMFQVGPVCEGPPAQCRWVGLRGLLSG